VNLSVSTLKSGKTLKFSGKNSIFHQELAEESFWVMNSKIFRRNSKKSCPEIVGKVSFGRQSGHSLVVKRYPSKLDMRVRFPLPAPLTRQTSPILQNEKTYFFHPINSIVRDAAMHSSS
jgi:hypothetical protein